MNTTAKIFCVACMVLCAACDGGTTDGKGDDNDQDNDVNQNSQPYDKTIGNGNYTLHNFMGKQATMSGKGVTAVNYYLGKADTYVKDLANTFNQSLNGRPAVQVYFNQFTSGLKSNNNYNISEITPGASTSFDATININKNACKPILVDVIKNLGTNEERVAFYECYCVLANEARKEGYGNSLNSFSEYQEGYEYSMNKIKAEWLSTNKYLQGIDIVNQYKRNNFTQVTDLTDTLLKKAVTNMNKNAELNLKGELYTADLQQVLNIALTADSLSSMHNYTAGTIKHGPEYKTFCALNMDLERDMRNTVEDMYQEDQKQYENLINIMGR